MIKEPRRSAEQIQAETLERLTRLAAQRATLFVPVTYDDQPTDTLADRMLKKIHNITAQHLPNYSPLTPTEIRAIHSAAVAGIEGPDPDYGL